jgi:hypothetical protein
MRRTASNQFAPGSPLILNSHGETVSGCVARIIHQGGGIDRLQRVAEQCDAIATKFAADRDHARRAFYDSVAADLRSYLRDQLTPPVITARHMDDLIYVANELERDGRGSMAESLYKIAMNIDPHLRRVPRD